MSLSPAERDRPGEVVGGYLAALSLVASALALVYRPVRIAPFASLLALLSAGFGGRHARLATLAVGVASVCWVIGMTIAIVVEHPLY